MTKKANRSATKRAKQKPVGSIAESIFGDIPPGATFLSLLGFDQTPVRKVHADFTTSPPTITTIEDDGAKVREAVRHSRKGSKS